MSTNRLKDAHCKSALCESGTIRKLFDGGGLFLAVLPSGKKSWRVAYLFGGRQQTKSFGPYPDVSLAEARKKRDELQALLRDGIDPMADRRAARNARPKTMSFEAAARRYWSDRRDVAASYREDALRALDRHLFAALGERDVAGISRADLLAELQKINDQGHYVLVRKVRIWAGLVLDWAVENDHATINPARLINPQTAFGRAKVEHMPALTLDEVPEFMRRLRFEDDLISVLACRMLALTWVRTVELRFMRWAEVDFASATWSIPATRMKRDRDHLVPLSRQALALLETLRARDRGGEYVFPSGRLGRPISENTILYLIYRIGYKGRLTGHGFRTIASTWANEHGYNSDAIERQLSHAPDDRIRSAYNRAEYLPARRQMLQDFADWLDAITGD